MSDNKKNYKKFLKDCKDTCNVFAGKDKKSKKRCLDTYMCNWNKCSNEYNDVSNAEMTSEDHKKCENADYTKQMKCIEDFVKKNDVENKNARYNHCVANKCQESLELKNAITAKFRNEAHQRSTKNCDACKTEINEGNKLADIEFASNINCKKKFDKFKAQNACLTKIRHKSDKRKAKVSQCIMKKCSKNNNKIHVIF